MIKATVSARALLTGSVALTIAAGLALPGNGAAAPATIKGAVAQLIAGPGTTEVRRGVRSFVPKTVKLRASSRTANTATVDLTLSFAQGGTAEARTARLGSLRTPVKVITKSI